jgi:TPR repeat protein
MRLSSQLTGIVAAVWLLLGITGSAWAGPFDDAGAAYQRGDYETAFELLKPLADKGNADAQFTVGLMYELGQGIAQNYDEAQKWYRLSADQGNVASQFNLAVIYYIGAGVPPDDTEAAHWYALAASQGFVPAQYNLGYLYYKGYGVPRDYVQAHKWWSLAAAQRHEDAIKNRNLVASKMTAPQIEEATRLALEWLAARPQ